MWAAVRAPDRGGSLDRTAHREITMSKQQHRRQLTQSRTLTIVVLAALALGTSAVPAAAGHSATPTAARSGSAGSSTTDRQPHLLAGDVRMWDLIHGHAAAPSAPMPGDVRLWELLHPLAP